MEWKFSRNFWSRSAGFPIETLDALRSDATCDALDRLRTLERAQRDARAECAELLRTRPATSADLQHARRARRALPSASQPIPAPPFLTSEQQTRWTTLQARLTELRLEVVQATAEVVGASDRDLGAARERLAALVLDDRVSRGAWLSSRSMARAFRAFATAAAPNARRRALERRAVLFLQRVAAKYPLLSDLGLCAWGRIDADAPSPIACEPGDGLVAERERLFEHWPIQALATVVHADVAVREHCPIRLSHGCALEARTLYYPIGHRANLEPPQVKVLALCDGTLTLTEVRQQLAAESDHEALLRGLDEYIERGVLTTQIPIPTGVRSEQSLLAFLRGLPDACTTKATWIARILALVELRDAMGRADSRTAELEAEARLDESFTKLTGKRPSRGDGAMHAGRFLTYEDTRRDVDLRLGGAVVDDLDKLQPLLDLSRWIVLACREAYEKRYAVVFDKLAAGLDHIDCVRLMRETQWISETTEVEVGVHQRVQQAWAERLGERAEHGPLVLDEDDFRAVLGALPAHAEAGAPWLPGADVHSLSILPALLPAREVGYQLVLGKLYKAVPFLVHPAAEVFCPARASVLEDMAAWLRPPLLQFVDPPTTYHRSSLTLPDIDGLHEALLPHAYSSFPPERTVRAGELVVTREAGHLWVQTRDGRVKCGLQALRWSLLQKKVLEIDPLPRSEARRTPRVTFGNWVLAREQWRVPTDALVSHAGRVGALAAARAWQDELGLPERIFVRSADAKAVYIDLRSHLFADLLVALARQTDELTVIEMLPTPEQCVMRKDGLPYVSELRLTALAGPRTI